MADAESKPIPEDQLDTRTRAQAKRDLHKQKQEERKRNQEALKSEYSSARDNPALLDILAKAKTFRDYHTKLAIDGVGAKIVGQDDDRHDIIEEYSLSDSEVHRELGGASALTQLIVYIENQLS